MLGLPEKGIMHSVDVHNSNFGIVCDWVEASVIFKNFRLSKSDIVDNLIENGIYNSQDFARYFVDDIWKILRSRFSALNNPLGIQVLSEKIVRNADWTEYPAYSFCMALSCSQLYPSWEAGCSKDFTEQGSLFEELSLESLRQLLPSWEVEKVGWSPTNAVKLKDSIDGIISRLREHPGSEIDVHATNSANEMGLDILAYHAFNDMHASTLAMMVQCASGKNWKEKRKTPDLSIWKKIINFNSPPLKAFVMPFSFTDNTEFRRETVSVDGLFIDRYRLLNPTRVGTNWVSQKLDNDLLDWLWPRVAALPTDDF